MHSVSCKAGFFQFKRFSRQTIDRMCLSTHQRFVNTSTVREGIRRSSGALSTGSMLRRERSTLENPLRHIPVSWCSWSSLPCRCEALHFRMGEGRYTKYPNSNDIDLGSHSRHRTFHARCSSSPQTGADQTPYSFGCGRGVCTRGTRQQQ